MRIVSDVCVPDILRDAGAEGMHIKSIAAATCTDENILGKFVDDVLPFLMLRSALQVGR